MCVSMGPIHFSSTIHGIFATKVGGRPRHITYYQNTVAPVTPHAARPGLPKGVEFLRQGAGTGGGGRRRPSWTTQPGGPGNWQHNEPATGNALIIPLLGDYGTIQLVDLSQNKRALKDIAEALTPRSRGAFRGDMLSFGGPTAKGAVTIVEYDIYTVVIAECASDIPNAVRSVPANKRPNAVQAIFDAFEAGYDSPIAVCCFDPKQAGEAAPVAFQYEPWCPEQLFLYTLDGHDGNAPDYSARVRLDHTLFVASDEMEANRGAPVYYNEGVAPALEGLLPTRVIGGVFNSQHQNGDCVFNLTDVNRGIFKGLRTLPPGAPAAANRQREFITLDD